MRPNIGIGGANSDRSAKITLLEDGLPLHLLPMLHRRLLFRPPVWLGLRAGAPSIKSGPQTIGGTLNVLTRTVPTSSEVQLELSGGLYGSLKGHGWLAWGAQIVNLLDSAFALRWLQELTLADQTVLNAVTLCSNFWGRLHGTFKPAWLWARAIDRFIWGSALMILMIIRCVVMRPARWG